MDDPMTSEPFRKHTPLQHQSRIAIIPNIMDLLLDRETIINLKPPFVLNPPHLIFQNHRFSQCIFGVGNDNIIFFDHSP
jgi:hypothetical protein